MHILFTPKSESQVLLTKDAITSLEQNRWQVLNQNDYIHPDGNLGHNFNISLFACKTFLGDYISIHELMPILRDEFGSLGERISVDNFVIFATKDIGRCVHNDYRGAH